MRARLKINNYHFEKGLKIEDCINKVILKVNPDIDLSKVIFTDDYTTDGIRQFDVNINGVIIAIMSILPDVDQVHTVINYQAVTQYSDFVAGSIKFN